MWYTASILTKGDCASRAPEDVLWEETIILLDADSPEDAELAAVELGRKAQDGYTTATGEQIRWTFSGVERIYDIEGNSLVHGTELFSRFLRDSEVQSLRTPFGELEGS